MKTVLVGAVLFAAACSSSSSPDTTTPDAATVDTDAGSTADAKTVADGGSATSDGGDDCSAARASLLGAVDSVSTGDVSVLSTTDGVSTVYVDASAGGIDDQASNPWIFVNLATDTKVSVTDTTSASSTGWDLAFKRPVLYTNDGDGGPGKGGAVLVSKDFDAVTAADATSATFATESFFGADCAPNLDPTGAPITTFSTWYDYDETTHILTPAAGTWLVRGGTGKLYKLAIETYYATPDGGAGTGDGGTYTLKVAAL